MLSGNPDQPNKNLTLPSRKMNVDPVLGLRDFFLAHNAASMAAALSELSFPPCADLQELEYEFNRLFVGPGVPIAPPYASVYLENEPRLMGESTKEIERFYAALGLEISLPGVPADFLALELEAWIVLDAGILEIRTEELERARQFLGRHLHAWLPPFIRRIRTCQLSPAMAQVVCLLEEWLKVQKEIV